MYLRPSWDEAHMFTAISVALRSTCLKRQVGAVLVRDNRVIASGYNGAPSGIKSCLEQRKCYYEDLAYTECQRTGASFNQTREVYKKYCIAVHAEGNALLQCSKLGTSARGAKLYVTNLPCPGCTRDYVISSELSGVFVWKSYLSNQLLAHDEERETMHLLQSAGISLNVLELSPERMSELCQMQLHVGDRLPYEFTV